MPNDVVAINVWEVSSLAKKRRVIFCENGIVSGPLLSLVQCDFKVQGTWPHNYCLHLKV